MGTLAIFRKKGKSDFFRQFHSTSPLASLNSRHRLLIHCLWLSPEINRPNFVILRAMFSGISLRFIPAFVESNEQKPEWSAAQ